MTNCSGIICFHCTDINSVLRQLQDFACCITSYRRAVCVCACAHRDADLQPAPDPIVTDCLAKRALARCTVVRCNMSGFLHSCNPFSVAVFGAQPHMALLHRTQPDYVQLRCNLCRCRYLHPCLADNSFRERQELDTLQQVILQLATRKHILIFCLLVRQSTVTGLSADKQTLYQLFWRYRHHKQIHCVVCRSLFKVQARYIVERMDSDLWNKVLLEDNQFRRQLIDQVCCCLAVTPQGLQCLWRLRHPPVLHLTPSVLNTLLCPPLNSVLC